MNHQELHDRARAAGLAAGAATKPVPMIVGQAAVLVNGERVLDRSYVIDEGACGFAWITIRPGTSAFARFAKTTLRAHKGYYGGMEIRVSDFGQSMGRKERYAYAYAEVLRAEGIEASAGSRMD